MAKFYISMFLGIIIVWALFMIMRNHQASKAASGKGNPRFERARAALKKNDEDMLGIRFSVPRENKEPVHVNIYEYDPGSEQKVPMIFVAHGGNLLDGDADQTDSFCNRMKDRWEATIISVNYDKQDQHRIPYQQEQFVDTVQYFATHAASYHADAHKIAFLGFSGGAYLQAGAAALLKAYGFPIRGIVQFYPLLDDTIIKLVDANSYSCPIEVVTCNNPKMNEKVQQYYEHLQKAGVQCHLKEYPDANQGFIELANPEYMNNPLFTKQISSLINDDQIAFARACEAWLSGVFDSFFTAETGKLS